MHILPSQLRTYLRGTLGCLTILAQIFILSSCASKLNLVPENYSAILEREIQTKMVRTIVRSQAARLDYAIPVAVSNKSKSTGRRMVKAPLSIGISFGKVSHFGKKPPTGVSLCLSRLRLLTRKHRLFVIPNGRKLAQTT
jgi:hypothetical protein